ncbi:MAG TPA: hypothetical protein VMZ30_00210 [Pyrinomonadaceae bacterium]|nr:hypothetical protein [Pyrinomonadaceae bacterium]
MISSLSRVMAAPVTITSLLVLYLIYNAGTRQTAIWYLNNNIFVSAAFGPNLPAGWSLVGP